jgi:hypothetical protein
MEHRIRRKKVWEIRYKEVKKMGIEGRIIDKKVF